jgi:hypothetical protein
MDGKAVLFKVASVVSALAIGGGYVAWRGADGRKAIEERPEERKEQARAEALRELDEVWERELMPGSKNPVRRPMTRDEIEGYLEKGRDFILPIPGIPEGSESVSNVVPLLPGSKSISMPVFTEEQLKALKEAQSAEKEPELLPSSKIGILRLPKKEAEPPKKKDPKLLPSSKSIDSILEDLVPEKSE